MYYTYIQICKDTLFRIEVDARKPFSRIAVAEATTTTMVKRLRCVLNAKCHSATYVIKTCLRRSSRHFRSPMTCGRASLRSASTQRR